MATREYEWPPWGEGVTRAVCDHCGIERPVKLQRDVRLAEFRPDEPNEPTYWCRLCAEARGMDR